MWNNNDTNDDINYNSITMENVLSEFNLVNFKNNNSEISVKNTGEININSEDKINFNSSLEIDKENNRITVETNLVLSDIGANPQTEDIPGVNGQINIFNDQLWIYLGNSWRRIRT